MAKDQELRKAIWETRDRERQALEHLLTSEPEKVTELLANDPKRLAHLLALAAQDLAGGGMAPGETNSLASAMAQHPSLMSRLLSGMGA